MGFRQGRILSQAEACHRRHSEQALSACFRMELYCSNLRTLKVVPRASCTGHRFALSMGKEVALLSRDSSDPILEDTARSTYDFPRTSCLASRDSHKKLHEVVIHST